MKKIFSLFVAALTTVTMFAAADVVLTSTEFEGLGTSGTGSEVKVEKGGITFICDKGFGDQYGVRCYKTSNVTITSSDKQIGKIYFEFATVSGKKYDGGGMPEEAIVDAMEWRATMAEQARMNKISIYFGNSSEIVETFDTLTVAQALEKAAALADNKESDDKYVIEGYVANAVEYSADYENQDFFLVDDKADKDPKFMAYRAVPAKDGAAYPVLDGDKVRVLGALKKYVKDGVATLEVMYPTVEFLEEVEGNRTIKSTTPELPEGVLSVADAVEAAKAIEDPQEDKKTNKGDAVKVRGFVTYVFAAKDGKQSAWIDDKKNGKEVIQGSYLLISEEVQKGDYVELEGKLAKYKKAGKDGAEGTIIIEVVDGTMSKVDPETGEVIKPEAPELPEGVISCAQAVEAAAAIADPQEEKATTKGEKVRVWGYVTFAYDASDGKQSAWLSDTQGSKAGVIQGAYLQVSEAVAVGDYVELNGTLAKYLKPGKNGKAAEVVIEVIDGTMKKVDDQGIENVVLTEKAQKIIVDGVIYIVRDNKMYNIQGVRVR